MSALERIAALVHGESGIVIRAPQYDALAMALARLDPAHETDECLRRLLDPVSGPARLARLIDEVAVNETFFLRHEEQLDEIPWTALLHQARANGSPNVRAWSVGCATGEEPYSIAMLACEHFGTAQPPVEILATDISTTAIARAKIGEYGPRSTRHIDPQRRSRYFSVDGDRLTAGDRLRAPVSFGRHNLVHEPVPPAGWSAFELILCRNVLIYFDAPTVTRVVAALERALARSGRLIFGAADALCAGGDRFGAPAQRALERMHVAPSEPRSRRAGGHAGARSQRVMAPPDPARGDDPLSPTADFLSGLAALEASNPCAAIVAFRRTLYRDPSFGLAAFQLGRCYDALGDPNAARRAYEQALRTLAGERDHRHEHLLEQVNLEDVTTAATARLDALAPQRRRADPVSRRR